jgi:hypothetical protein
VGAIVFLVLTLAFGAWMARNDRRFFGFDAEVPSDNASPRGYGKAQVWMLWLFALVVFGYFAYAL